MKIRVTKFVSESPLTKKIYIKDGELKKESSKALSSGLGEILEVEFSKLGKLMEACSSREVLCYGTPDSKRQFFVTTKDRESLGNERYARTEKNFPFRPEPTVFYVDHDPNANCPKMTPDSLHKVFVEVCPEVFKGAAYIERGSVSAGAHKPGEKPKLNGGFHLYYLAADGTDLKRFSKVLQMKLWEAGYGYILVTAIGAMKPNTVIDGCVTQGCRIDYTGAPILDQGVGYLPAKTKHHAGKMIDTTKLESFSLKARESYSALITEAKKASKPASIEKATEWKQNRVELLCDRGISKKKAEKEVSSMLEFCSKGKLFGDFEVYFQEFGWTTIRDIVSNPDKYHDRPLCEPTENPDEYSQSSARCYVQGRVPTIRSWAHGWNGDKIYLLFKDDPSKRVKPEKIDKKIEAAVEAEIDKVEVEGGNEEWRTDWKNLVDEMNNSYAVVALGNVTRIMVTQNRETKYITERDFHLRHRNEKIQVGEKVVAGGLLQPVYKTVSEAWLDHSDCEKYLGGVEYAPGQNLTPDKYNLWEGLNIDFDDTPKTWKLIKKHIEEVICNKDSELINYFYDWCAYTLKHPDRPGYAALVLKGKKGTGKGVIMQFLMSFWAPHTQHITSADHFVGKFNAHLATCSFLYADEAFFAGDRKHESSLKGLITEDTIPIERKGVDKEQARNYLRVGMSTNEDWVIPASSDERRFAMYEVTTSLLDLKAKDKRLYHKYFKELRTEMADPGAKLGFYNDMMARDIEYFSPGDVPRSEGLAGQIEQSFKFHESWLQNCLEAGSWTNTPGFDNAEFRVNMNATEYHNLYKVAAQEHRLSGFGIIMRKQLNRYLTEIFGDKYPSHESSVKNIKDLGDARRKFEAYYGIKLQLDNVIQLRGPRRK